MQQDAALELLAKELHAALAGQAHALDPRAFGGLDAFLRQMDWLVGACHDATPREGVERVRLPGERGMKLHREQLERGVLLHPTILPSLAPWAAKFGVNLGSVNLGSEL